MLGHEFKMGFLGRHWHRLPSLQFEQLRFTWSTVVLVRDWMKQDPVHHTESVGVINRGNYPLQLGICFRKIQKVFSLECWFRVCRPFSPLENNFMWCPKAFKALWRAWRWYNPVGHVLVYCCQRRQRCGGFLDVQKIYNHDRCQGPTPLVSGDNPFKVTEKNVARLLALFLAAFGGPPILENFALARAFTLKVLCITVYALEI